MALKNFRASDFRKDGSVKVVRSIHDRVVRVGLDTPEPTSKPIIAKDADPNAVPSGTVPEILTWVGEDADRAKRALDVENENERPRRGLIKQLISLAEIEE